jgi:hypothetical protein
MQTHLDCIPCFLHQSLEAARMATEDEQKHELVMKNVMQYLETIDFSLSPPEISRGVHAIVKQQTNNDDPYKKVKQQANREAQKQLPKLKQLIDEAEDSLLMAVKLSIIGNVVDFGTMNRYNVMEMINDIADKPFDDTDFALFKKKLDDSSSILYLADNTGEIVFDKLLLEQLHQMNKDITYVVKSNPIINDATIEDACFVGIDRFARVVNGDDGFDYSAPGLVSAFTSSDFKQMLTDADMVISKGQGNYESLSDSDREIFFLLMVKCPLVARNIQIDVGTMVLKVNA